MQEKKFGTKCPKCAEQLMVKAMIPDSPIDHAPVVRGELVPVGAIFEYRFTSEDIKQFIVDKASKFVPGVKVEVVPRYCEKKRRRETDPHRSYASLRIALSQEAIEKKDDFGWFGKIGESTSNVRVIESLFVEIIQRYKYNRKEVEKWLKSYKNLEELEEALGMTEAYINDLRLYSTPQRVQTTEKESWIIFSAAAENVIRDMLTEVSTNKLPGKMLIKDVYPISKEIVEFVVHLNPSEIVAKENPHVRQILLGEEKPKK